MQKSRVEVAVRFQNLKFPDTGNKWKKCERRFINNKFSFKLRRRNLFKSRKIFQIFADVLCCTNTCSNLFFTLKWELEFLPTAFAVILTLMALPILLKVELNFEEMMYIIIFVSHIRKAALNMWSVVKTYLKVLRSSRFRRDCRKKDVFTWKV